MCCFLNCFLEARKQQISNHPIVPTLNDAYETWFGLKRKEKCDHSTKTSVETKENCAYVQRRDLALDMPNCANPIYEQIM